MEFGQGVVSDLQKGDTSFRQTLKKRGLEAVKSSGRRLVTGAGRRKKRKRKNATKRKRTKSGMDGRKTKRRRVSAKRNIKDVFQMI